MGTCSGLIFTTSWQRQRWLVPTRVELWNFSHCFGQHSSGSTFSTKNTATNASFRTNTWPSTPPPPTSRGQRVFGDRLRVRSNLAEFLVFFYALWKNGDFSYRSRVPTAGICLWWISWAPPSGIIVSNTPRKMFENYGAIFGVSAFQNIGTNR